MSFKLINTVDDRIYEPPYEMTEEDLNTYAAKLNSGWHASGPTGPWLVVSDEEVPDGL